MAKNHKALAKKIVENLAVVNGGGKNWDVNLIEVVGFRHSGHGTKQDVMAEAAGILAADLKKGNIVLSDTWEEDNLGNKK